MARSMTTGSRLLRRLAHQSQREPGYLAQQRFMYSTKFSSQRYLNTLPLFASTNATNTRWAVKKWGALEAQFLHCRHLSSGGFPKHKVLSMPAYSPTMKEGRIISWLVEVGEEVSPGDILAEIETDKTTIEFEAQEPGVVAKILQPAGDDVVLVNEPVIVMCEETEDVSAFASYEAAAGTPSVTEKSPSTPAEPEKPAAQPTQQVKTTGPSITAPTQRVKTAKFASPLAKTIASKLGLSIDEAVSQGTGPGGRIIRADVEEAFTALQNQPATTTTTQAVPTPTVPVPMPSNPFIDVPVTQIRKVIARKLLESKQTIPHYYLSLDCEMDSLMKLRAELNAKAPAKISVNDFVLKAAAKALMDHPELNSHWMGESIRQFENANINVAVQTDNGLLTPLIKSVEQKGFVQISSNVKELAGKARDNKLQPADLEPGSFTISNLGMFGIKNFCAIINPPQAGILAVGTSEQRLVPSLTGEDDEFKVVSVMNVTLSCDHRVVDGAVGAQWLTAFKGYIENPTTMLL